MGARRIITKRGSTIQVSIEGVEETRQKIKFFSNDVIKIAGKTFNKMLVVIRKEIRNETPVNTGDLRKTVRILKNIKRKRQFTGDVGPDGSAVNRSGQPYHNFVIFGTLKTKPNNFVVRGFNNAKPKMKMLVREMNREINQAIRKRGAR